MIWKTIRLELASDAQFLTGSASRAFLLHLPVDDHGAIDADAIRRSPTHATVRRFWASEPDQAGHVECAHDVFIVRCGQSRTPETILHLGRGPLRTGSLITVRDEQGAPLLFRVASMHELHASERAK